MRESKLRNQQYDAALLFKLPKSKSVVAAEIFELIDLINQRKTEFQVELPADLPALQKLEYEEHNDRVSKILANLQYLTLKAGYCSSEELCLATRFKHLEKMCQILQEYILLTWPDLSVQRIAFLKSQATLRRIEDGFRGIGLVLGVIFLCLSSIAAPLYVLLHGAVIILFSLLFGSILGAGLSCGVIDGIGCYREQLRLTAVKAAEPYLSDLFKKLNGDEPVSKKSIEVPDDVSNDVVIGTPV